MDLMLSRVVLCLALAAGSCALRDVRLELPPVVRAGGCATLRCLYDLEGMPLYSVKWYRGNFEFFRVMPKELPARQAFPYPDIHVDVSLSNEQQVTLCRVPLHMAGNFSCEVSTDGAFTTAFVSGQVHVLDTVRRPLLTVARNVYAPGDVLEVNCSLPEVEGGEGKQRGRGLQLHPGDRDAEGHGESPATTFAFWINNMPVPRHQAQQLGSSSATFRRELTERDFSADGELHVKCVAKLAGLYREPSRIATVRRQEGQGEQVEGQGSSTAQPVSASAAEGLHSVPVVTLLAAHLMLCRIFNTHHCIFV